MNRIALSLALLLSGCASLGDYDGYTWVRSNRPPLPYRWTVVDVETLQGRCGNKHGWITNACAIYLPGLCLIVAQESEQDSPQWLVRHEKFHCSGYDHLEP